MRTFFQKQLELLNRELTQMGTACEQILALVSRALTEYDESLVNTVQIIGEQIDESYRTVEAISLKLLLRQQPVASDLRIISAALKMITDLERIGDQAEDIVALIQKNELCPHEKYPQIREMANATKLMVTDAISSYVRQDLETAYKVMTDDDIVDAYFSRVKQGIIAMITDSPQDGEAALDLLMIAKYFERIGDHCTNIAEWVVYSITGEHKSCQ